MDANKHLYKQYEERCENAQRIDVRRQDKFCLTQIECSKGVSPKMAKHPKPITFEKALECITNVINYDHRTTPSTVKHNSPIIKPNEMVASPSINFYSMNEPTQPFKENVLSSDGSDRHNAQLDRVS